MMKTTTTTTFCTDSTTLDLATLAKVTGGRGDNWETMMGDAGTAVGSIAGGAAGAFAGRYLGSAQTGMAVGSVAGTVVGGVVGRSLGRSLDGYQSPPPVDEGRAFSWGRGPGSLNRGAGGMF